MTTQDSKRSCRACGSVEHGPKHGSAQARNELRADPFARPRGRRRVEQGDDPRLSGAGPSDRALPPAGPAEPTPASANPELAFVAADVARCGVPAVDAQYLRVDGPRSVDRPHEFDPGAPRDPGFAGFPGGTACGGGVQCLPSGPPYEPACRLGEYYYFHDNQFERVESRFAAVTEAPWRHVGRIFHGGSGNIDNPSGGTGTLIARSYVLCAAHSVLNSMGAPHSGLFFALAQTGQDCTPYGASKVNGVWVPKEYLDGPPPAAILTATELAHFFSSHDYAVLSISGFISLHDIPDPAPMHRATVASGFSFEAFVPRATGYTCGAFPSGSCRLELWPYTTTAEASIHGLLPQLGDSGLIVSDVEGTRRMSGAPLWIWVFGVPVQVGVLVGSTCSAAHGSEGQNWAVALTADTQARINAILGGHPPASMLEFQTPPLVDAGTGGVIQATSCNGLPD